MKGFAKGMARSMVAGCGFGDCLLFIFFSFWSRWTATQDASGRLSIIDAMSLHCPTNGDHNCNFKGVKPPIGIPKSMLVANPDGSYVLPNGDVAVLKPNDAVCAKEVECLPSICFVSDISLELHCPLCKDLMKDAMLTSECCFSRV